MWWYYIQTLGMGIFNPSAPVYTVLARRMVQTKRHKTIFHYAPNFATPVPSYAVVAAVTPLPTASPQILPNVLPLNRNAPQPFGMQRQAPKVRNKRTMKYATSNGTTALVAAVTRG